VKILVTGGGGFAGRHLLRDLLREGSAEVAATHLGGPPPVSDEEMSRVRWMALDVNSDESVRRVMSEIQPDVVYHLAGQASVGRSLSAPLETWEVNATGTLRVLMRLAEVGAGRRLLLISSAEVYGAVPPERQPIGEGAPVLPITPYGSSKAAAEVVALQMGASLGVEVVVARSFNHIGPGQDERFVLPSIARQLTRIRAGEADPVVGVGNLDVERDFLDVRDVVRAYRLLMASGEAGGTYNVSSGVARTLLSVVQRLLDLSESGARLEVDPSRVRPIDIPLLVGDASRLRRLGWEATRPLDETLRDLLEEAAVAA
jgi:GDP-4-dehydro-6-deoxy-D-mannose reductase